MDNISITLNINDALYLIIYPGILTSKQLKWFLYFGLVKYITLKLFIEKKRNLFKFEFIQYTFKIILNVYSSNVIQKLFCI